MILNAALNLAQPDVVPECLQDLSHELTQPINQYLTENRGFKIGLMIASSLLVDITVIVMAINWIVYGRNMRLVCAIVTFYIFKICMQEVFFFDFPSGYIWEYPGFPSLTIPYYRANDFFFSAEIGLCMIAAMDFKDQKMTLMKYFAFLTIIFECFVLIVCRAHFIIDLTTGIIAGHYFYWVGTWIDNALNKKNESRGIEGLHHEESRPLLF